MPKYLKTPPDPDARVCHCGDGNPDCDHWESCDGCGMDYRKHEGHDCIDGVPVQDLRALAKELRDALASCETERDRLRSELDASHDGEDALRSEVAKLRAQIAALQSVPQGVEVPEPPESEMPHVSRSLHSGEGDFQRYRGFEECVEWARKNARLVPTPPQADAVVVPRPLSKAPTDRPILAFWQSGLGTISDVVHYFDEEGRFVCWCEMLEYEDNGGNLDFVPRDAQWIELPDALRTSAQDHNGEGAKYKGPSGTTDGGGCMADAFC